MSKKIIDIDGKKYLVDSETKEMEEVQLDEQPKEEAPVEEAPKTEEATEENVEEVVEKASKSLANEIIASLPLDKLNKALEALDNKEEVTTKAKSILNITEKEIATMDNKTKTTTWFKAVLKGDVSTVKALSEGNYVALLSLKTVNCWKTLSKIRTISSQAWTAMSLKVQRLVNETLKVSNFTTSAV